MWIGAGCAAEQSWAAHEVTEIINIVNSVNAPILLAGGSEGESWIMDLGLNTHFPILFNPNGCRPLDHAWKSLYIHTWAEQRLLLAEGREQWDKPLSPYQLYLPVRVCYSNDILYNMPIQSGGMSDQRAEVAYKRGHSRGWMWGVCVLGGSWGHRGRGMGEVWGRKEGGKPWFPVPQIPSSCLRSRYTKPPLKGLERGGRMKRSHWWLTDLSPWTPPTPSPFPPFPSRTASQCPVCLHSPKPF